MGGARTSGGDREAVARLVSEIRGFVSENFLYDDGGEEGLSKDDSFMEKGIIDSTGILEIVAFVEESYGISVQDDELIPENLDSIEKLAVFVARKRESLYEARS